MHIAEGLDGRSCCGFYRVRVGHITDRNARILCAEFFLCSGEAICINIDKHDLGPAFEQTFCQGKANP